MAHTISNLDLDMRIALGNVLYAANDFRHSRSVGNGLAWGLGGCSNCTGAVGSRKPSVTGLLDVSTKRPTEVLAAESL